MHEPHHQPAFLRFDRPELEGTTLVLRTPPADAGQLRANGLAPLAYLYARDLSAVPERDVELSAGHYDERNQVWCFSGDVEGITGITEPASRVDEYHGSTRPVAHPLLKNEQRASSGMFTFEVNVSPAVWVFAEHKLNGVPTLPGAGVVALVHAAYQEATAQLPAEICNLRLFNPVMATSGAKARVELSPTDDGWFDVVLWSAEVGKPTIKSAEGRIGPAPGDSPPLHDLAALRQACPTETTLPFEAEMGPIELGRHWDNIVMRRLGEGVELVSIALAGEFAGEVRQLVVHPAILYSAVGINPGLAGSEAMFLGYDRILIRTPLPARCHSFIQYPAMVGDVAPCGVTMIDDNGVELARVDTIMTRTDTGGRWPAAIEPDMDAIPYADEPRHEVPFVAPSTDTEQRLAAAWQEVLHLDKIGVDDDFFQLSGDSLMAVQLVVCIGQDLGIEVSSDQIISERTIRNLASLIDGQSVPR